MVIRPETWQGRMKAQYERARLQVGPMAESARDLAASRIIEARTWAAPRLDQAAHSVEDQLAPRVSSMLSEAARKVDPKPRRSRRLPIMILVGGLALGAAGFMIYRKNTAAREWTDSVAGSVAGTVKETAADASQWAGEKAGRAGDKIAEKSDAAGHNANRQAEDIANRLS
ncbi:hypothetical protein [Spongiactinospora sp. TRM90649]|uniref:hypothetical protein n=1 Tax=Spongiactinospora sp. TRM90649 TaxID=3031114 RepID=UPI0023F8C939|nr:hypothetical protein [Spongiactinospora sp. TRM90649]MDF5752971.1 hypothetical protein [Spongiactinospora sp. TRM90649]